MMMATILTILAGLLAAFGLGGILLGAAVRASPNRQRIFRFGSMAMAGGGLLSMLSALIGVGDMTNLVGGLMMLIFGTAVSLPKTEAAKDGTPA